MAGIEDLLNQIPLDQIAGQLGLDPEQARSAAESGLGALMNGMEANAKDPAGAASLGGALNDHSQSKVGSLDAIDTADGQKIVDNIFGDKTDAVVQALGDTGGGDSSVFSKLLPMLAPIVMGFLGDKMAGGQSGGAGATGSDGGGLADVLGGLLGGAGGAGGGGGAGAGGGGLADLLGGMLGGGKR